MNDDVGRFFESIKNLFSSAGIQNWRDSLYDEGGMAEWYDPNSGENYALTVERGNWSLSAGQFTEEGNMFEPDEIRKAYEKIRINLFDARGGEEPVPDIGGIVNDSSRELALEMMAAKELEVGCSNNTPIRFIEKEADYGLAPLHRDYLDENYRMKPGDAQIMLVAEGANQIYETFNELRGRFVVKEVQFERIEELRYAGSDNHIDRGKIKFKVRLLAGPHPYRRAGVFVIVKVKDGEVQAPLKFIDSGLKERMLSEESVSKYLGIQENARGRARRIQNTEHAHIDRTLYPSPRAHTMFRGQPGMDEGTMLRNLGLGGN